MYKNNLLLEIEKKEDTVDLDVDVHTDQDNSDDSDDDDNDEHEKEKDISIFLTLTLFSPFSSCLFYIHSSVFLSLSFSLKYLERSLDS
jgi:hypothetical protein